FGDGPWLTRDVLVERRALDVIHYEIVAAGHRAGVVNGDDVRMFQAGEDANFAIEAGLVIGPGEGAFLHDFERDLAVRRLLEGEINNALAAAMDFANELVAGQPEGRKAGFGGRARRNQCFVRAHEGWEADGVAGRGG